MIRIFDYTWGCIPPVHIPIAIIDEGWIITMKNISKNRNLWTYYYNYSGYEIQY